MKLALVYHQCAVRGGLERYLKGFAAALLAAGHEIDLITATLESGFCDGAQRVHRVAAGPISSLNLAHFARASRKIVAGLPDCDAALGFGRTTHQTIHRAGGGCHAVYSDMLPWWKRWRPKNRLELHLERQLYTGSGTRAFVVNAPKVAAEIQSRYGVAADRLHVIPTPVDTDYYRPAPDRAKVRAALGIPQGRPVFLMASLDHHRKGLATALRALARLENRDALLWVAGAPLAGWMPMIHELGLADRVHGLNRVADLRPYYQAADAFVHPTRYDACANTVLQAMASGLPSIVSSNDGAIFHLRHAENGWRLAAPDDADAVAGLMQEALRHPTVGSAARASVLPLTWDAHVAAWTRLMTSLS
jgi:UDP-glucose:(heptosyl)LPS alpha-1,3-glucosyltransferase